ncbi:MAG: hypothetical protein J5653_03210 [Clostridiales bacterium]|nr:hypothetical protein [Clostridiales bacterium]
MSQSENYVEILSSADQALKMMEFSSAKEKYEKILESDPSNFSALRGLVCCAGKINSVSYIQKIEKLKKCDITKMRETVAFAEEKALAENKAYFSKLSSMLGIYDDYCEIEKTKADLADLSKSEFSNIVGIQDTKDKAGHALTDSVNAVGQVLAALDETHEEGDPEAWSLIFTVCAIALATAFATYKFGMWGLVICFGIAVLVYLLRWLILSRIEAKKAPYKAKLKEIQTELNIQNQMQAALSKQYEEEYSTLTEMDPTK